MRALDVATKFENLRSETMAGVLGRFSFATAAEKQLKQRKHCRARTILLVFKKIFLRLFIPNCTRNHMITHTNRRYDPCSSNYDDVKKMLLLLLISFFLLI